MAFRYDFTSKFSTTIGDEIFINVSRTDAQHIFDHDRLFTNFSFKPKPSLKFDIGYIYISRLPKSNADLIEESNFLFEFYLYFSKVENAINVIYFENYVLIGNSIRII